MSLRRLRHSRHLQYNLKNFKTFTDCANYPAIFVDINNEKDQSQ